MAAAMSYGQSGASFAGAHDDDSWHVELAPGDVKVLSLERVDDLYRLEIIDESTRLWQPGMRGWTRLGIVAGIEPEPGLARPVPARPTNALIPPPPAEWPPSGWSGSLPVGPPAAAPFIAKPAPVKTRTPDSLRPLAIDDLPFVARQRGGGGGFLVMLALLCGIGITLYRNDVLRQAAGRYGLQGVYSRLEAAVGAPGFGTPRSIEEVSPELVSPANVLTAPPAAAAPQNVSPAPAATALKTNAPGGAQPSSEKPPAPATPVAVAKESQKSTAPPAAAPPAQASPRAPAKARTEQAQAAKVEASSETAPRKAGPPSADTLKDAMRRSAARAKHRTQSSAKSSQPQDIGIKGSRHEYDPLNPKL